MRQFDIQFEVNQKALYLLIGVEAETPEQAIEIASDIDFDRHEAEEDCLLDSYDDTDTIKVVGERVSEDGGVTSRQEPFNPPVIAKPTPFQTYTEARGNTCPLCGSSDITAHPFNADDLSAWRDVDCMECETVWREMFTMQNIDIL